MCVLTHIITNYKLYTYIFDSSEIKRLEFLRYSAQLKMGLFGYEDNFFQTRNTFYTIVGLRILTDVPIYISIIYYLYSATLVFFAMVYYIGEIIVMKDSIENLYKFLNNLEMFFTHLLGIIKFFILTIKERNIQEMMRLLENPEFKYKPVNQFQPYKRFNEGKRFSRTLCKVIMLLYLGVGGFAHLSAVVGMHTTDYGKTNDTRVCQDFVTYYSYLPVTPKSIWECHILFALVDFQLGVFASYIAGKMI